MRISLCQTNIIWEDKSKNYKKAASFMEQAEHENSDIILFPEMSFTGFSMNIQKTGEQNQETISVMRESAERYQIAVGFGWVKLAGSMAENHYTVIDSCGNLLGDYVKIHPFSYAGEDRYFKGGDRLAFAEFKDSTIGISICYDLRFPELYQGLSKAADIIIVPANWPAARSGHWEALLKARAIENQAYMIGINCVGEMNGILYSGDSCVFCPNGEKTGEYAQNEKLVTVDIDQDVEACRRKFPVKQDRRTALYKRIL